MKIEIQRSNERGHASIDWLDTNYSFSFANYFNPKHMGFGALRVLNDDTIAPAKGFGFHSHDNMEIVTIVLEGTLEHRDSNGNHGVIKPGEVQSMSAGSGITHSEFNHSKTEPLKLLQIWVQTKEQNIEPSYAQKKFSEKEKKNRFLVIASGNKKEGGVYIHQDARFLLGNFDKGKEASHEISGEKKGIYVFVIKGKVSIGKETLSARDGAEISGTKRVTCKAIEKSEILLIEVPI